jgi:DNA polymerase III epsilon subunit-like protein
LTRLCFIDTETTSLRPDRRAWDIALIVREPGKPDTEHQWFVDARDLDLGNADPAALAVGRFYERHPQYQDSDHDAFYEYDVLDTVEDLTRSGVLIGSNTGFDAETLARRMRARGILPSWHYRPVDVGALAAGFLTARDIPVEVPWDSGDLAAELGVYAPEEDRHTALGDARWVRAIWDTIHGSKP